MLTLNRLGCVTFLLVSLALPINAVHADSHSANQGKDRLVLGMLPILSPERLAQRFEPLVDYLSDALGVEIVMESAPSYRQFVERTGEKGRYDLLYTAPHFYYLAKQNDGYRVMVRVDGRRLEAAIVAPKASQITSIKDLRGHSIATPDSSSLGTLLIRQRLVEAGLDPDKDVKLVETPTHNASLLSAVKGNTDAAGLMTTPLKRSKPAIREQVRVLSLTANTPQMPFSVAPWVDADVATAFARAMVEMKNTPDGRALLKHLAWPGFIAAQPAEYDVFGSFAEKIRIE